MDSNKTGYVMVNDLQKHFLPVCHPEVVSKKKTVEEVMQDLYGCLKPPIGTTGPRVDRGCVTYAVSTCKGFILTCSRSYHKRYIT